MTTVYTYKNQFKLSFFGLFVVPAALIAAFVLPNKAWAAAGGIQICEPGGTCEVGEFLYDDSSQPITGATCTLDRKDPSGTALTQQALTPQSDGWYAYKFTAPTTEGLYRSELCCSYSGDYLCIDKSFEIKASSSAPSTSDIASAVWGYSDRTVTSLGTLVRDIWLHSNRSLTSFSLSSSSSSSSNTSESTDLSDLAEIKRTTKENRLLLEELVNKPIIENYLENQDDLDIGVKLKETEASANGLFANTQYLRSKTELVLSRWNSFSEEELLNMLVDLGAIIGQESDNKSTESVFGEIKYLSEAWDWKEVEDLKFQAGAIKNILDSTTVTLSSYGKSSLAYKNIKSLNSHFDALDQALGDSSDKVSEQTLFGHLQEVSQLAKLYQDHIAEVDELLTNWESEKQTGISTKINQLASRALPLNRIHQLNKLLTFSSGNLDVTGDTEKELKNKAFGVRGVLDTNIKLLAMPKGRALSNTWLELGSIVFKSVVTNPSKLISQTVPLKYYLPPEVREEHIIKTDDSLKIEYDAERDQYFVSGEFELDPGETITLSVQTEDIWAITEEEVQSVRNQIEELAKPLEHTALFAQSVTLISDINVSLDKVLALQATGVTPEAKIRAYREALIEMDAALIKVDKLKELVAQASQSSTLLGFIGGVQAMAVWGLIIIMAAGFVFLALYMKVLKHSEEKPAKTSKSKKGSEKSKGNGHSIHTGNIPAFFRQALTFLIFGTVVSLSTGAVTYKIVSDQYANSVLGEKDQVESGDARSVSQPDDKVVPKDGENSEDEAAIGGVDLVRINVPAKSSINVRSEASLEADVVYKLQNSLEVIRISDQPNWTQVAIKSELEDDQVIEGWVYNDFIEVPVISQNTSQTSEETSHDVTEVPLSGIKKVFINKTPTGWLRVRSAPSGSEVTRVYPGESYELVGELDNWYKIKFPDNSEGFVSKTFTSLEKAS